MLNKLHELEQDLNVFDLNSWDTLYMDCNQPYIKSIYKKIGNNILSINQVEPSKKYQCTLTISPAPFAIKIIKGNCEIAIGYSERKLPEINSITQLPTNTYHEVSNKDSWHYIRSLEDTSYFLMISGESWNRKTSKIEYPFRELGNYERNQIISVAKNL